MGIYLIVSLIVFIVCYTLEVSCLIVAVKNRKDIYFSKCFYKLSVFFSTISELAIITTIILIILSIVFILV